MNEKKVEIPLGNGAEVCFEILSIVAMESTKQATHTWLAECVAHPATGYHAGVGAERYYCVDGARGVAWQRMAHAGAVFLAVEDFQNAGYKPPRNALRPSRYRAVVHRTADNVALPYAQLFAGGGLSAEQLRDGAMLCLTFFLTTETARAVGLDWPLGPADGGTEGPAFAPGEEEDTNVHTPFARWVDGYCREWAADYCSD